MMISLWQKAFMALAALAALPSTLLAAPLPEAPPKYGFLVDFPRDASVDGWRIDWLIEVTTIFIVILFVIMCVWMFYAAVFHNEDHEAEYDHGTSKHSVTVALLISALVFFVMDGNLFYHSVIDLKEAFWNFDKAESDPDCVRVEVNARQWAWQIRYAGNDKKFNTADDVLTLNDMPIPAGAPVVVQLGAVDVLHSFYLPNFRTKIDAVPGTINRLWFQSKDDSIGEYDIGCAQHCGTHHYKMKGVVKVLSPEEYAAWLSEASTNAARGYDSEDLDAHWGWAWERG